MEVTLKPGEFNIRRIVVTDHGYTYPTFQVIGYLAGQRVWKQFKSLEEASGEKSRLEVAAANSENGTRTINIRLSVDQVAEAEACIRRLGDKSLTLAVDWFMENYRPPVCREANLRSRHRVCRISHRTRRSRPSVRCGKQLKAFNRSFVPNRLVHTVVTADVLG